VGASTPIAAPIALGLRPAARIPVVPVPALPTPAGAAFQQWQADVIIGVARALAAAGGGSTLARYDKIGM
jgi:hypothetical protein